MNLEKKYEIRDLLSGASGIAWDTCHKVYILMDDTQMDTMRRYEYDPLISSSEMSADEMLETVVKWYEDSCGLRFIQAIDTMPNGEEDYTDVIGQFDDIDEEEDDE